MIIDRPGPVRLVQVDGRLPNLALMRLSHWLKAQGREVVFTRSVNRTPDEPDYATVLGSAIFKFSDARVEKLRTNFPGAIVGGTGGDDLITVERLIGDYEHYDYSLYPEFPFSIGFTQRGCRPACEFCVVPKKEGKPRSVNTIHGIWRGPGYPKKIHLLDNDFFGNPHWRERIAEIREGDFKVCFNQGINVRILSNEVARALATIQYRDDQFQRRRLYTAWDNIGDERIFFRGVDRLEQAGVPGKHLMAYMLIGFDPAETWGAIFHRFRRMTDRGILPYPMVFDHTRRDLKRFQRWVVTGLYRAVAFEDYDASIRRAPAPTILPRQLVTWALAA